MAYSIERMPERISIGRETETGVTDVMIDCGAWVSKWPGMALHAIHTPEGGTPYILQTETDGGVLVWHVTDADTATPGTGRMEIVGEMDGRRKVSATVKVSVAERMSGTVGQPPEAAKPWADRVVEAAGRITGMQVQAETLEAGSSATAAWDGEQGLLTIGVPKGKDGKDAVVDATLTQRGQAADAKATGDALALKLTEPSTGLAVGKYFRIAAINENGHAVLEAVDLPSAPVQDVQVTGTSIVADGVANVPIAGNANVGVQAKYGLVALGDVHNYGLTVVHDVSHNADVLTISTPDNVIIDNRNKTNWLSVKHAPLMATNLDYAVKAAMCDGKGAAWTSEEQAAARERMGIPGDYELIEEITLSESVDSVLRTNEPDGTAYNLANAFLSVYVPQQDVGYIPGTIWVYFRNYKNFNAGRLFITQSNAINKAVYMRAEQRTSNGIWLNAIGEFGPKNIASTKMTVYNVETENSNITGINIKCSLPAGAIIQIYGVRI